MGMYDGAVKMLMLMLQKYSSLAIVLALIAACYSCEAMPLSKKPPSDIDNHFGVPEYDHEAFWGKEEAEELSPEEGQRLLRQLTNEKIDRDGNGQVNESELKDWILFTQQRNILDDAEEQMQQHDTDKDGFVTWVEYKDTAYGFLDEGAVKDGISQDMMDRDERDMMARDERRFQAADADGDGKCDKKEFSIFLHPENGDDLKSVSVEETLEDIDKNGDGRISLDEYIGDLWPEEDRENGDEPDWVKDEKENFRVHRDKDNDGYLNSEEVSQWILPEDYNHVESEAKYLISESDEDQDGQLSIDEIVSHYDLFVGSQATDFGEALKKI